MSEVRFDCQGLGLVARNEALILVFDTKPVLYRPVLDQIQFCSFVRGCKPVLDQGRFCSLTAVACWCAIARCTWYTWPLTQKLPSTYTLALLSNYIYSILCAFLDRIKFRSSNRELYHGAWCHCKLFHLQGLWETLVICYFLFSSIHTTLPAPPPLKVLLVNLADLTDKQYEGTLFDISDFAVVIYRKTSYISRTSVGNKIVDNSDVVGASPVGAAPTTTTFSA